MLKFGYRYTKKQFGQVPGPLSVFCARMPLQHFTERPRSGRRSPPPRSADDFW